MTSENSGDGGNPHSGYANAARDDLLDAWSHRIYASVSHISDGEKAGKYLDTALKAVAYLGDNALRRLLQNVGEVKFYESVDDLMGEYHKQGGVLENTRAFYSGEAAGSLHFDGGRDTSENMQATLAEVYSHEIGHAIDGPNLEFSSSPEWQLAWRKEISTTLFNVSQRMRDEPDEGFAFFCHLVINKFRFARLAFPQSFQFWQTEGLV